MAFFNKGLEIRFTDERTDPVTKTTFKYNGGIVDFVKHLNASKESLFRKVASFEQAEEGQEVEIALQWNTGYHESIHSFANGISTIEGGMHVEGFSKSLTNVVNRYARARNLLKEKEENLKGEDIREGLTAIISVRLRDPQFEGQTKAKLGNQSIRSLTERTTNQKLTRMAGGEPARGQPDRAEVDPGGPGPDGRAGRARPDPAQVGPRRRRPARASWPTARRATRASPSSSSSRGTRPGVRPRTRATRVTQAILPIRGKILNVERARIDKMLKNLEIQALISAIGAGLAEEFDVDKIRYHKVILLADADVDGSHIRTLLFTFFFRQMKPLVEGGSSTWPSRRCTRRWSARRRSTSRTTRPGRRSWPSTLTTSTSSTG